MIVGQHEVRKHLNKLYDGQRPPSILLNGIDKSQMQAIMEELAKTYAITLVSVKSSVEDIRGMIEHAYAHHGNIYMIEDAASLSNESKNALLKVIEEPPNLSSFVLLINERTTLPPTIASRSHVIALQPYKPGELKTYYEEMYPNKKGMKLYELVDCPSEIDILENQPDGMVDYVKLVANRLGKGSLPNAYKIITMISLKVDDGKWDAHLFCKTLRAEYYQKFINERAIASSKSVAIIGMYMDRLSNKSINKQMLLDRMIKDLWEVWAD